MKLLPRYYAVFAVKILPTLFSSERVGSLGDPSKGSQAICLIMPRDLKTWSLAGFQLENERTFCFPNLPSYAPLEMTGGAERIYVEGL
jgi:hypothetical protein